MGLSRKITYLLLVFLLFNPLSGVAQEADFTKSVSESLITGESLRGSVEFLADTLCEGRATGTRGAVEASFWIARRFKSMSLLPMGRNGADGSYFQSFSTSGAVGHNVLGFCPSPVPSDRYIIVAAHYDGIGVLSGRYYPGADSNASGVAVLLDVARTVRSLSVLGRSCRSNIIFAALDAKQANMAGAAALYGALASGAFRNPVTGSAITPGSIEAMVNLDIIGSTLEPVTRNREDYLIMLTTSPALRSTITEANYSSRLYMNVSFDYYRSDDFTDLFLRRLGDQKVFIEHGIPAVLFTSGITMNTNKVDDTSRTLNYEVLRKRALLISRWLSLQ